VISEMSGFIGKKRSNHISLEITNEDPVKSNMLYTHFNTKLAQFKGLTDQEKEAYKIKV
tara:strand:- start:987 stop:1163 length:177 start_codon:yes stop_codon:yes gene_type:complete